MPDCNNDYLREERGTVSVRMKEEIKPKKKPLYHYYATCFGFLSKDYMCVCFAGDVKPEIKNQTTCFNNLASTLLLKYHFLFFSPSVDNLKKYRIK